ncbi:hypothetical protein JCM5350_000528 [Sporobolomyces pararoseus]
METDYESPPTCTNSIRGGGGGTRNQIKHKRVYGKKGRRRAAIARPTGGVEKGIEAGGGRGGRNEGEDTNDSEDCSEKKIERKGKGKRGKQKKRVEISSEESRDGDELVTTTKLLQATKPSKSTSQLGKILTRASIPQTDLDFSNEQPVASTSKIPYSTSQISKQTISQSSRDRSRSQQDNLNSGGYQRPSTEYSSSSSKGKHKAFPIIPSAKSPVEIYRAATTITSSPRILRHRRVTALSDKSNLPTRSTTTTTTDSPRLTDLPPTLPFFERQFSSKRFSLSSTGKDDKISLDKPTPKSLQIYKDSSSTSNPLLPPRVNLSNPPPKLEPPPPPRSHSFSQNLNSPHPTSTSSSSTSQLLRSPPPKFQFTTTIFDNSTSFDHFTEHPQHQHQRSRFSFLQEVGVGVGGGIDFGNVVVEGKEGDGMGMESDFVLESFVVEEQSQRLGREKEVEVEVEDSRAVLDGRFRERGEGDEVVDLEKGTRKLRDRRHQVEGNETDHRNEVGDHEDGEDGTGEKTIELEKGKENLFADESGSTIKNEASEDVEITLEKKREEEPSLVVNEEDEEVEKGVRASRIEENRVETVEEKEKQEKAQSHDFEPSPPSLEGYAQVESPIGSNESVSSTSQTPEPIYDASHLPPRRPRFQLSSPTRAASRRPPSDEDDLAFLIRTTATHSSEDDLPPPIDSDLSSDERDFQSAEREVGRGIKSGSGQRRKRVELKEKMRNRGGGGYLRIGEGKGGRRLKWKREIVDLASESLKDDRGEEGDDELELKRESESREESGW